MKRFVNGITEDPIWQKRVPKNLPEWLQTATVAFPSGRTAGEFVANDEAHLAWAVNLGVIDFNPHPVRRDDLDHPDELRVDLDPTPDVGWAEVRKTAMVVNEVLSEHGLRGYPKTSGSKGIHVNVRIEPVHDYIEVRRAALALAREVERRAPEEATSKWWKEERHGVFVDYNQNARDRTVASGYSVRPTPDGACRAPRPGTRCPMPSRATCGDTVPERLKTVGDPAADIDLVPGSLDALLDLARRDEEGGLGDAPWPPHFPKQRGEPKRVQPSRDTDKPKHRGRAGDPQPGGPPPGFSPATPSEDSAPSPGQARATRTTGRRRERPTAAGRPGARGLSARRIAPVNTSVSSPSTATWTRPQASVAPKLTTTRWPVERPGDPGRRGRGPRAAASLARRRVRRAASRTAAVRRSAVSTGPRFRKTGMCVR